MTRKIIIALLSVFILSACGSNVETIPTSTPIPALQSTSTFTPEPTATQTIIPTATPFRYSSCLDPALQQEIINEFPESSGTGLSIQEWFEIVRASKNYSARGFTIGVLKYGTRPETLMYVGYEVVNVNGIKTACANFVSSRDPNTMIPVLLGFESGSSFQELITLYDSRTPGEHPQDYENHRTPVEMGSMSVFENWMNNSGLQAGDIVILRGNVLEGIQTIEQFANLDERLPLNIVNIGGHLHSALDAQVEFLRLTGNEGYLARHKGTTFLEIATELSLDAGDVGILADTLDWFGSAND